MQSEFDALIYTNTRILILLSPNYHIANCKWLFKTKCCSDGTLNFQKASLVVKGYTQQEGLDYTTNSSPVVKSTTIRLVLSLGLTSGWPIQQLDVQNVFQHGFLLKDVYMSQPSQPFGFVHPQFLHYVCKLNWALYGLKQAPQA